MRFIGLNKALVLATLVAVQVGHCIGQSDHDASYCKSIGGTVMTDLAVVDPSTTLGTVTGDLKGSVAAKILSISEGSSGSVLFHVQHHFVTDSGDIILTAPATATTTAVAPGLYAILNYPVQITGGTGGYAGATGEFNNIGAADLNTGRTIFRYSGKVCFADGWKP